MRKLIKFVAAGIIIVAFVLSAIIGWKVIDNIRLSYRQDLQESFKRSLSEYGKR